MPNSNSNLKASIDLGTNTALLLIAEWDSRSKQVLRVLEDHAQVVGLGRGVDKAGELQSPAMERALKALHFYANRVRQAGLATSDCVCVGTASARDARNGKSFFDRVKQETGFAFRVISGDEEAELSFRGALDPEDDPSCVAVIDIGGGSTELMSPQGGQSLQMGSVRFTERHLHSDPVTADEFQACLSAVDDQLLQLLAWKNSLSQSARLVGVAGTVTTLAQLDLGLSHFDAQAVQGHFLSCSRLESLARELAHLTIAQRAKLPGVSEGRADVLLAGAIILWRACQNLGFAGVKTSTRGLRYGILQL